MDAITNWLAPWEPIQVDNGSYWRTLGEAFAWSLLDREKGG